jgi:hypothetical protein
MNDITEAVGDLFIVNKIEIFIQTRSAKIIQHQYRNKRNVKKIKSCFKEHSIEISNQPKKLTEKGSLKYLLKGPEPSEQSISIKFGHVGEKVIIEMIKMNPNLELLKCGIHILNDKFEKKDIDILWRDTKNKVIYYREAKSNIELDTEKLPAMISKIKDKIVGYIEEKYIKKMYPDDTLDIGVINWSVYNREYLKKGISQIKKCETEGIKIDHFEDILRLTQIKWSETDFYDYLKEIGKILFSSS